MNCPDCGKFISARFPMHYCAKPKNKVTHYNPSGSGVAACGIRARCVTADPCMADCKRCINALMPWAKQAWNEAHQ